MPGRTSVGRRLAGTLIAGRTALALARDRLAWFFVCAFFTLLLPLQPLHATWLTNGNDISGITGDQRTPDIMADGYGGAILVWSKLASSGNSSIYAQRINAGGSALWGSNGITVCTGAGLERFPVIASDGIGGAIIAWEDSRNEVGRSDIYVQRIDLVGAMSWRQTGVPICTAVYEQESPEIIPDGAGGAVIVWSDRRGGHGYFDIYAQKIDRNGYIRWAQNGVQIFSGENLSTGLFDVVSDGAGGAIVVWQKRNRSKNEHDIYAQRIDQNGVCLWKANGLPLCVKPGEQLAPRAVRGDDGMVVVVWSDARSGSADIYAQKISTAGILQWAAGAVPVCGGVGDQRNPRIVATAGGGALIAWDDRRTGNQDIYYQKMSAGGTPLWAAGGLPLCTESSDQALAAFIAGGNDQAVAVWYDGRNAGFSLYAQKVDGTGSVSWVADGVPACATNLPPPYTVYEQKVASDGAAGAMIVWQDNRGGSPNIFAQRMASGSNEGLTDLGPPASAITLHQNFPNPFNPMTRIGFDVEVSARVSLRVFDASGKLVRTLVEETVGTGRHEVFWNGKDDAGRKVASGVYFYRLEAGSSRQTRKMVLLR